MKKLILALFLSLNVVIAQNEEMYIKNQLIVKLKKCAFNKKMNLSKNTFGIASLDKLNTTLGLKSIQPIGDYKLTQTFLLIFKDDVNVKLELEKFQKLKDVEFIELDYKATGGGNYNQNTVLNIPNDTFFNKQWGLLNDGTMTGIGTVFENADVDMDFAWNIQTGDPSMIIAVSDSGLKMNHPDIASRIWVNTDDIPGNGIDDDLNGFVDDLNGWDWVNNDNNPTDDHGHGTNCTGIIGAIANNNSLFSGVNWNSKIMPLKVLNSANSGSYSAIASSIFYAVDNGAKIISMSIGGSSPSTLLVSAIDYANLNNVMLFFCMMNNNNNVSFYPARYSLNYSNVVAVGSTNPDDSRTAPFFWSATSGSNYGTHINVVAPGNYIYGLSHTSNTDSTSFWGGTSQATPLVAGIASLLFAQNPSLTPSQVRTILQNTAVDEVGNSSEDTPGFDQYMGYGRVNAFEALQLATLNTAEIDSTIGQEFVLLNPIKNDELLLNCKGNYEGDYQLKLYAMDGKLLFSRTTKIIRGDTIIPFNFPSGNYIFSLQSDLYTKNFKVNKL